MVSRFVGTKFLLPVAVCLLAFTATPAFSQATSSSSIAGLVTDEQGAAIPGAQVRLTSAATSTMQMFTTNEAGRYAAVNIAPDTYQITVTKEGFTVFKISAQKVDIGTALTVNATLKVGATSTTVETASTPVSEPSSPDSRHRPDPTTWIRTNACDSPSQSASE